MHYSTHGSLFYTICFCGRQVRLKPVWSSLEPRFRQLSRSQIKGWDLPPKPPSSSSSLSQLVSQSVNQSLSLYHTPHLPSSSSWGDPSLSLSLFTNFTNQNKMQFKALVIFNVTPKLTLVETPIQVFCFYLLLCDFWLPMMISNQWTPYQMSSGRYLSVWNLMQPYTNPSKPHHSSTKVNQNLQNQSATLYFKVLHATSPPSSPAWQFSSHARRFDKPHSRAHHSFQSMRGCEIPFPQASLQFPHAREQWDE